MYQGKQGDVGDLRKKTNFDLKELLRRQEKLLSNRSLLRNLPDGGAKLKSFVEKINVILEERGDVDGAAQLLDTLSLGDQEKTVGGKERIMQDSNNKEQKSTLESVATTSGSDQFQSFHSNIFNKKFDEKKEPFRPSRTLKSTNIPANIPKPIGHEKRKEGSKTKDLTSAYSPPVKRDIVKPVDLSESLRLQRLQQEKFDILRAEQAAEKLAERLGIKIGAITLDVESAGSFREPENVKSDDDDEGGNDFDKVKRDKRPSHGGMDS
ncbi:putative DNA-directed RNA polymerase II subunit GRINL1A [Apostichopus japonicus]|uniref:Putative DNA-directed RNA polymerase II subunit GRINL1A n=1 Tax=Stichopus japonicus TaxID=307972 RepID=A0A2G8LAM0_STIJA|nr:putative DNA-directed RNA polymerase II subunit GRINL1A [Apostichopus japonicus]